MFLIATILIRSNPAFLDTFYSEVFGRANFLQVLCDCLYWDGKYFA